MNEALGLILIIAGVALPGAAAHPVKRRPGGPRRLGTPAEPGEGATPDHGFRQEAAPWMLAAGLALVLAGLAALAVEPGEVLLALVMVGALLGVTLALVGHAIGDAETRRHSD
ncbi:hypothetical protein [Actinomadura rubrisoli]|uniref:SdpI family protein n=1 Tax=Actinomadura rubrisoli TaxID=2530368 RepID=A0A4R5B4B3_9ACTN|nr:hypothetical protein [Actinomadura rubrisoli]TDD79619.1 hypothetical protein E1298_27390 [Actinomadura rubrisoli]